MNQEKLQNILFEDELSKDEILYLLEIDEPQLIEKIFKRADQVRKDFCGEEVHLRGIVEISNYCEQNCLYCSLREDNFSLKRYRMEPDEIIETAREIIKNGIYTVMLQSGEDSTIDSDILSYIIYSIKNFGDVAVSLSLGERGFDEYRSWKIAGADRYLLKHETCSEKTYAHFRGKKFLTDRIQHLKYLKRLGFQIGSGNIVGLPSQTLDDIADDILLLRELNVDIVDISQFFPYYFTPFQNLSPGDLSLTLKTLAITRIVLKDVHIHSLPPNSFDKRSADFNGLSCGSNVIIADFTPSKYDRMNQFIAGKTYTKSFKDNIKAAGRNISFSKGDSLKSHSSISF